MLNYEFPPLGGGAAIANYYLLKELARNNAVTVDLITSSANNKFTLEQFSKNITIYELNVNKKDIHYWRACEIARWTWKAYWLAKKLIKNSKYDLCHCWFGWPSGLIGYKLKNEIPYFIALRGSDVPGFNPRLKTLDKFVFTSISKKVCKTAKAVVANSEGLKQLALKTRAIKIDVIYNGVDVNAFKPKKNQKSGKKIKLISTGRLIERKGYKYLIKALAGLEDKFELTLIGGGDKEEELKELARTHGVNVDFRGVVKHQEIANELQNADIFVLPSLNEGMSHSMLEAMACGLPVIVTDAGGMKELIKDNGYVIKKASVNSIKDTILRYNDSIIKQQGMQSRKIAEGIGWEKVAEQYCGVYKKCLVL